MKQGNIFYVIYLKLILIGIYAVDMQCRLHRRIDPRVWVRADATVKAEGTEGKAAISMIRSGRTIRASAAPALFDALEKSEKIPRRPLDAYVKTV